MNSPLAITMGFAVHEAAVGNYADAMEALEDVPVHWRRTSGVLGQGGDLRRRRTLDRRHRRGAGRRRLAGQVPGRRGRRGARRRGGQPRAVHRGRTPSDRIEFVAGRGGVRARHRLVSGDDASQPGQRGGRRGAAGVAAGHPPGAESRCRAEGSDLPAGDHHGGEDRVAHATRGIRPAWWPTPRVARSCSPRRRPNSTGRSG